MEENQTYELSCLISPTVDEKTAKSLLDKIKETAGKESNISQKEEPKKIKLAYPIKKQNQAFLAYLSVKTKPEKIKTVKTEIEKIPEILRFILIKKEPSKPAKAAKKKEAMPPAAPPQKEATKEKQKVALEQIEKELDQIL